MKKAQIDTYDPVSMGMPGKQFRWEDYDAVVMDYNLNNGTALDWLYRYSRVSGYPPTVVVTGEGNESIAVRSIKMGASDYLTKDDLNASRLAASIMEAIEQNRPDSMDATMGFDTSAHTEVNGNTQTSTTSALPGEYEDMGGPEDWPFTLEDIVGGNACVHGYRITGYIGKGGMGTVFKANREVDDTRVAIKLIHGELNNDPKSVDRFIEEYNVIENIEHPGVVKVYAQGFADRHAYIVMEYLPAGHLRKAILQGIKPSDAIAYAKRIIAALAELHSHNIIHRDLKPMNIIFRDTHSPVLVDFGVAKDMEMTDDGLTTIGRIVGTPVYSSPEQIRGRTLDGRSDLYSFGTLFYEMLTGKRLFTGNNMYAIIMKHVKQAPPPLPDYLANLQPIMSRLLHKKPELRYQCADKVLEDLEQVSG